MNLTKFERLPTDIVPTNYALTFTPDLEKLIFTGKVVISVTIDRGAKTIQLNSYNLDISSAKYESDTQRFESEIHIEYSEEERIILTFPREIVRGKGTLTLTYSGTFNDRVKGFYRYSYATSSGTPRFGGVTQFEPNGARRVFPCWDEPALKATFDISLVIPKDRIGLSNMLLEEESKFVGDPRLKVLTFVKTPVMSTYLVAFAVGEFEHVEDEKDGAFIRVYTPLGKKEQGLFALSFAKMALHFYKDYFKIPYPLPKLDLVAITDFEGIRKSWGLVTCRETNLLLDEHDSILKHVNKQKIALLVGREIAHQWFGNLVTHEWWTDLWLSEGLANWITHLCVDYYFPDLDVFTHFVSDHSLVSMNLDALKNSHPVEVIIGNPSELEKTLDTISFSKGASVIRMLHDYIGDEEFRKSSNAFLTKYMNKNACTDDFWNVFAEVSGKSIRGIIYNWTRQVGYPMLKLSQRVNGTSRILTVEQERFLADGSKDDSGHPWIIPISVCSASKPNDSIIDRYVLGQKKNAFVVADVKPNDWIKLNIGGAGFYRTNYPVEMLDRMVPGIKNKIISPRDRLSLQNDLFALARAGMTNVSNALKLAESFDNETNYIVWRDLDSNLSHLGLLYQSTEYHEKFNSFIRKLYGPTMKTLGWNVITDEDPQWTQLRSLVIGKLGSCGDGQVIEEARRRFKNHCEGHEKLPVDLKSAVYSVVLHHGTEADLENILRLYRSKTREDARARILASLGSVNSPELIRKVLEFFLSHEVRAQDGSGAISGALGSLMGRELVWKFVKERWGAINEKFGGSVQFPSLLKVATERLASEDHAKDVKEFFEKNPTPSAERSIRQSLENIHLNIEQLKRDRPEIEKFLEAY